MSPKSESVSFHNIQLRFVVNWIACWRVMRAFVERVFVCGMRVSLWFHLDVLGFVTSFNSLVLTAFSFSVPS